MSESEKQKINQGDEIAKAIDMKRPLERRVLIPILAGFLTIALFFGGFGAWAVTAPISGAAIANGTIGPENSRRVVQHLEGGVVRKIFVKDGDQVKQGEVLVELDDTQAKAQLEAETVKYEAFLARKLRLEAELELYLQRKLEGTLVFPDHLLAAAAKRSSTKTILNVEKTRFKGRLNALRSAVNIYQQTAIGYQTELDGLKREIETIEAQLRVNDRENELYARLRKKGLELQSRVLQSERNTALSEQTKAERLSRIGKLREDIKTTRLKERDAWVVRIDETVAELSTVGQDMLTAQQAMASYRDTLERLIIASPVDGTIISRTVNTIGGVLAPGATIVEIVPAEEALTMEVRVKPDDIDVVGVGQKATIVLLAYPQRNLPKVYGTVDFVSADSLYDENAEESYYSAKVKLNAGEIDKLGPDIKMMPGMAVQVMIQTTSRTFFDYLISPVMKSADRAFREE